jgi:hypothetical protein
MKIAIYGLALALLLSLTSSFPAQATTLISTPEARAATSVPVQTVVWRRGVRGYRPYGRAAYRSYYRPYYGGYYRAYRPYYGAYYGGWYY